MLAHVDAGKTTFNEALLYRAGVTRALGSVNQRTLHLDHCELERQRGITIYAKQARIVRGDVELTLIDMPGHVDFAPEAERTLAVLDYALLLVDVNDGVRGHAMTLWRLLERCRVLTFVFGDKMDAALRSSGEPVGELSALLSGTCIVFSGFDARELRSFQGRNGASSQRGGRRLQGCDESDSPHAKLVEALACVLGQG